jgi:folate-binding protein YgfZ
MPAKIARLQDRTILRVTGPEAEAFLHNIVTADIHGLAEGAAAYTALLTPQGKILFDVFIVRSNDGYLIDCARDQSAALLQRLAMYKLRTDVSIAPDDDTPIHALWDGDPGAALTAIPDPRTPDMGWRLYGEAQTSASLSDYHAHRIARGIADSIQDIGSGEVFPHEANLDQLSGISFTKGCYVGQEVVSRMHHRGTARSRFIIANAAETLTPGTDITAAGRRIGEIKSVAGHQALALIRIDRLARARAENSPVFAGAAELTFDLPAWAQFTLDAATADEA